MRNMVICGCGYISGRVADGCKAAQGMRLYGFQSRRLERARDAVRLHGATVAYGSFEDVLADPAVDFVYLCTPNGTHVAMARQALLAGKAVICEKPLSPTVDEARELFSLARAKGVLLMEAAKTLASPLLLKVRESVRAGSIGELYGIEADYCYDMASTGKLLDEWVFGHGGGCALDIGVYPAALACLFATAPVADAKVVHRSFGYPVDADLEALVEYEDGLVARLSASWMRDVPGKGAATLLGTRGRIEIPAYWKAREAAVICADGTCETISVEFASDFTPEIEAAAAAMERGLTECPGLGEAETLAILSIVAS